jgi:hypothetical protein
VIRRVRQAGIGISAALQAPSWLRDSRLRELIDGRASTAKRVDDPGTAIRFAFATLRVLGRVPLLPYRNSCLYRSVAECLVLPRFGIHCRLRIGVRRHGSAHEGLEAHAWVERNGEPTQDVTNVALRPSR